jgi:hypothetical protein
MAIRTLLEEELENSLRMEQSYIQAMQALPVGSLVRRRIKGHDYYYLVFREKGRVRTIYKGRPASDELQRFHDAGDLRRKYRGLLTQCRRQVAFLRRMLRARSAV